MKKIIQSIFAIALSFAFILSLATTALAAESSVTVSLSGKSCGLTAGAAYKVTLCVSDATVGGLQGSIKFDTANFDFQNVTVPNGIAKVNRLTKGSNDVTTAEDIVVVNEVLGTVDFVVLCDKASTELLTLSFKVSENATNIKASAFSLANVRVSQSGGAKPIETVGITNITASSHQYGEWTVTKNPTLYTKGEKSRACSVCGNTDIAETDKLPAAKAEIKLIGATRLVLIAEDNREYSLDGENWQSNNIFIGLTANTDYSIYSRTIDTASGEISGTSVALAVTTTDIDGIVGNVQANDLSGIRRVVLFEEKYAWADVNGDAVIDVRDIIRLKKVAAGYYNKYEAGDFNHDGSLDSEDYGILADYLNGSRDSINSYIGDINRDGILDINDLNLINN